MWLQLVSKFRDFSTQCIPTRLLFLPWFFMSLNGDEYSFPTSYLHQGYLISLGCYNRLNSSLNITLHLPLDNKWHYKTENRWRHIYIHNVLDYKIYVNYDFYICKYYNFQFQWILYYSFIINFLCTLHEEKN